MLRSTIYVTTTRQIEEKIAVLQSKFGVVEIKNKLYDPSAAYASVYVIFKFEGVLAELQLIAVEASADHSKKLRKKVCHALYEIYRSQSGPLAYLN